MFIAPNGINSRIFILTTIRDKVNPVEITSGCIRLSVWKKKTNTGINLEQDGIKASFRKFHISTGHKKWYMINRGDLFPTYNRVIYSEIWKGSVWDFFYELCFPITHVKIIDYDVDVIKDIFVDPGNSSVVGVVPGNGLEARG